MFLYVTDSTLNPIAAKPQVLDASEHLSCSLNNNKLTWYCGDDFAYLQPVCSQRE